MNEEQFEELLDGSEAAQYLAKRWGIESYSIDAFRMLRYRYNIKPVLSSKTATFWRTSDLDAIPQPSRHNPRPKRTKKNTSGDDGSSPCVLL
jgi:hypothetical protein